MTAKHTPLCLVFTVAIRTRERRALSGFAQHM
jgi:hypothetical protein